MKKPKKKEKHKSLEVPLPPLLAKSKDNLLVRKGRERYCFLRSFGSRRAEETSLSLWTHSL